MVEKNELNRSLLTLLDENIASAQRSEQVRTVSKIFFYFVKLGVFQGFFIVDRMKALHMFTSTLTNNENDTSHTEIALLRATAFWSEKLFMNFNN